MNLSAPRPTNRPGIIIAILSLTGMAVSIMQTLVVPLLPHLSDILHTSPDNATWVLTMTLMFGAVSTPIMGRLGDMVGKRRMLLVAIAMMVVGSALCALSTSLAPMLVGRAFQGAALGSISLGISLMRDVLPRERLASAVALMSATLGIGGALGLPLSSIVAEYFSWHYLFVGSAVLGFFAFIAVISFIPESTVRAKGKFDYVGAALLSSLLVFLLFGFTKTRGWGWGDARVLGCFALAVVLAVAFYMVERRSDHPMVDMRVTTERTVKYTNLASILAGFAMYSCNLVVTQLVQAPTSTGYGFGQGMIVAGLCAAPMGFLMMLVSPVAARVVSHHGPRFAFISGLSVILVGFLVGIFMLQQVWEAVIVAMLVGAGVALSYAAAPTLIMRAAPPDQTAVANSVNTLSRSVGTSLASAVHGGVLATAFVPGGTHYGPLDPFQLCFVLAVAACVIAIALALRIPNGKVRPSGKVRPTRVTAAEMLADIEDPDGAEVMEELRRSRLAASRTRTSATAVMSQKASHRIAGASRQAD